MDKMFYAARNIYSWDASESVTLDFAYLLVAFASKQDRDDFCNSSDFQAITSKDCRRVDAYTIDCVRKYPKSVFDDRNMYWGEHTEYTNNAA